MRPDVGLLIVTHENLAVELVRATGKIVGAVEGLEGVSIAWDTDVEGAREQVERGIRKVERKGGVLILTDMFGGTPTNISLSFLKQDSIEIVTGVNLPMLIKFFNLEPELSLQDIAERIRDKGRQSIHMAMEYLQPEKK
ncbi:MAG: PTS sugar transporter subunit IIA [Acidobacteriota bacterium]